MLVSRTLAGLVAWLSCKSTPGSVIELTTELRRSRGIAVAAARVMGRRSEMSIVGGDEG